MFDDFGSASGNSWDKYLNSSLPSGDGNGEPVDAITPRLAIESRPATGATSAVMDMPLPAASRDQSLILLDAPFPALSDITTSGQETQAVDGLTGDGSVVEQAISLARDALTKLATDPDFTDKMNLAFGESWDDAVASDLAQDWLTGDFSKIPLAEIRAGDEINGANGAFAGATNSIYLSREFVAGNADNPLPIVSVLLEEIGHYIDSQINSSDAAGDEGAILAGVLQGKEFDAAELQALKAEDDTAIVMLDGTATLIEQAANQKADFNGDGKTDFIRQEKNFWDDDTFNTANVYLSTSNGSFSKLDLTNQADMKGDLTNLIFGDFNGDRRTDFIRQEKGVWDDDTANTANVYLSNGNGTFWKQDLTNQADMKGDLTNLIVGDYNGDGKDDFIRQEKGVWDDDTANTANVYLSNGNGTFWKQDLTNQADMKGDLTNLIVGDYNGDGKDDFIRQEKGVWDDDTANTANVYLSNGNGTFSKQDLTNQADMKGDLTNLIVGDFNGDRRTDFIRQEKGVWDDDTANTANVYLSNGNGTFWKQDLTNQADMKGDLTNLIVSDYNGDGKDDFIRQEKGVWDDDTANTANVYLSNGNGTFWKQDLTNQADMKGDLTNLIVGDFNGDRRTDFIRQEKGVWDDDTANTANVYLANSNGTFWKQDLTNDPNSMKGDDGVNILSGSLEASLTNIQTPITTKPSNPDIDIRLDFFGNFTQAQKDLIEKGAQNWERIITKDMVPSGVLNLAVTQGSTTMAGGQWGAWAETDFFYPEGIIATPNIRHNKVTPYDNQRGIDYHAQMHFNSNRLPSLSNNLLVQLATHEVGHALYLDEAQNDSLLGMEGVMDKVGLDQRITEGIYRRLEYLGYGVDRNAPVYWS